jgi:hypothetical protein
MSAISDRVSVACAEELGVSAIRKDHSWATDELRADLQLLLQMVDVKKLRVFDPKYGFICLKPGPPRNCPHGGCRSCQFW